MKTVTIMIATVSPRYIEAFDCGNGLAVHGYLRADGSPAPHGRWVITHIASGRKMPWIFRSKAAAVKVADELAALTDWKAIKSAAQATRMLKREPLKGQFAELSARVNRRGTALPT